MVVDPLRIRTLSAGQVRSLYTGLGLEMVKVMANTAVMFGRSDQEWLSGRAIYEDPEAYRHRREPELRHINRGPN